MRERGTGSWLTRLSRGLGLQGEPPRWRLAGAGLLAGGLLLACPWRFEITAEAELEPAEQRRVFAPDEGVVQRVLARDGDEVQAGALLLELDSTPLQARRSELETALQTQRVRLQALQTSAAAHAQLEQEIKALLPSVRDVWVSVRAPSQGGASSAAQWMVVVDTPRPLPA
ncbi:MAG: biotin/lipoyl-binding protein, partial [Planctomycetaceae bacterium]